MKVAILILAHKNENQLKRLVDHLSTDFDIYLHIDKRSDIQIDCGERVSVFRKYKTYWMHINFVYALLYLLEVSKKQNYDRYLIISGQDLPIKSNKDIQEFFTINSNTEFLEYSKFPVKYWENGGVDRVKQYWTINHGSLKGILWLLYMTVYYMIKLVYASPIKWLFYRQMDLEFYGGSNWMDLTNSAVETIISNVRNNPKILKRFKFTKVPDEIFFQTLLLNSNTNLIFENKCLRFIDWSSGPDYPKTLKGDDFDRIYTETDNLFARKFDEIVDEEIIDRIYQSIS